VSAQPKSKREQSKQERRLKIIAAASHLIETRETTDFTMKDLADSAGVSLATPYNLFGSKNHVILGVLEDRHSQFQAKLAKARAKGDALDAIFASTSIAKRMYAGNEGFYRAVFRQLSDQIWAKDNIWQHLPARGLYRGLVDNAVAAGFLRTDLDQALLARNLGYIFASGRLDWITEAITLNTFERRVKWGQALLLYGAATPNHQERLNELLKTD